MQILLASELAQPDRDRLRSAFPNIEFTEEFDPDRLVEAAQNAEVILGGKITPELLESARQLKWIMARSAGVNHLPLAEIAARRILLTNGSGAHGVPIAENTLAMMLAFATGIHRAIRVQESRTWIARDIAGAKFELEGQTLLIAGLGDLGQTLAAKARGLGMRVLGVRRQAIPTDLVNEQVALEDLPEALGRADHVALCLPLTPATTGFLDERQLRAMKPTAYVYNAGRGESIRKAALLRALDDGWIAGAGLDTTDPEPLPPDDPLWNYPNVILSQHTSGSSPANSRRITDLFIDNLRRYINNQPLRNLVDPDRRY